eukprot:897770-Rhodomonas_salina.1
MLTLNARVKKNTLLLLPADCQRIADPAPEQRMPDPLAKRIADPVVQRIPDAGEQRIAQQASAQRIPDVAGGQRIAGGSGQRAGGQERTEGETGGGQENGELSATLLEAAV